MTLDSRAYRRGARRSSTKSVPKSFSLDLSDLSRDIWSLLPQPGDFVAEVRTRRFDDLTYARSSGEAEDVTLFHRGRKRNIAAYASEQKLRAAAASSTKTTSSITTCSTTTSMRRSIPDRDWMEGRTRMRIRVKSYGIGVLTLRFADSLNVSSVTSDELGRLLFLRVRNQNSVLVNLPRRWRAISR